MLFKKPKQIGEKISVKDELSAVLKFLEETDFDIKNLIRLLDQFKILTEREKETKDEKDLKSILTAQIRLFDRVLKTYEMFELDTDIGGERLKNIAKALSEKAVKIGASEETIKKIKTSEEWTFDW